MTSDCFKGTCLLCYWLSICPPLRTLFTLLLPLNPGSNNYSLHHHSFPPADFLLFSQWGAPGEIRGWEKRRPGCLFLWLPLCLSMVLSVAQLKATVPGSPPPTAPALGGSWQHHSFPHLIIRLYTEKSLHGNAPNCKIILVVGLEVFSLLSTFLYFLNCLQ